MLLRRIFQLTSAVSFVASVALATSCPSGFQSGKEVSPGLIQLTGTFLGPKQTKFPVAELPDPAPPYINEKGEVEIYGSADYFIRYPNWDQFLSGGCYEVVKLPLFGPNQRPYDQIYTHPWDIRKYRIEENGKPSREILLGGAMTAMNGKDKPVWPDDNWNRRVYFFRLNQIGQWVRDIMAVVGDYKTGWEGHSYGGNLIQEDRYTSDVLNPDQPGQVAFFYEKVTEVVKESPYKTEIFAVKMANFFSAASPVEEIPILTLGNNPYPSTKRTIGGYLIEGPRPIQVKIKGESFYLVGFSSGDFPTDSYTINFMWSKSMLGPYKPMMNSKGTDLLDFGQQLKTKNGLSWVGRPSLYARPDGSYEMMFHGVLKTVLPDNDYSKWPTKYNLWEFFRCLFKTHVTLDLDANGEPTLRLDVRAPVNIVSSLRPHN